MSTKVLQFYKLHFLHYQRKMDTSKIKTHPDSAGKVVLTPPFSLSSGIFSLFNVFSTMLLLKLPKYW